MEELLFIISVCERDQIRVWRVDFGEGGKLENVEKKTLGEDREPTTNSTYI